MDESREHKGTDAGPNKVYNDTERSKAIKILIPTRISYHEVAEEETQKADNRKADNAWPPVGGNDSTGDKAAGTGKP